MMWLEAVRQGEFHIWTKQATSLKAALHLMMNMPYYEEEGNPSGEHLLAIIQDRIFRRTIRINQEIRGFPLVEIAQFLSDRTCSAYKCKLLCSLSDKTRQRLSYGRKNKNPTQSKNLKPQDGANSLVKTGPLPSGNMLMMDRVIKMSETGGHFDKGYIEAELDIKPELWFFGFIHFVNDPVMPGCLGLDVCGS